MPGSARSARRATSCDTERRRTSRPPRERAAVYWPPVLWKDVGIVSTDYLQVTTACVNPRIVATGRNTGHAQPLNVKCNLYEQYGGDDPVQVVLHCSCRAFRIYAHGELQVLAR